MTLNKEDMKALTDKYAKMCGENDTVEQNLFAEYGVKRGLRDINGKGVLTGITNISRVESTQKIDGKSVPCPGRLFYRGYNIKDLVNGFISEDRFGFEEIAYLLLFGKLPKKDEIEDFNKMLSAQRKLPTNFVRDVIMKAPSADIMNSLTKSILTLASYDKNASDTSVENVIQQSVKLISTFPMMAVYGYHAYNHYHCGKSMYIHRPLPGLSTAENLLRMLRPDKKYTHLEAKVLDLALVLHMEHGGGNNSTFTTRVVTSSGSDTYATIAAALCSLKGPRHGGANVKVVDMFQDIKHNCKLIYDFLSLTCKHRFFNTFFIFNHLIFRLYSLFNISFFIFISIPVLTYIFVEHIICKYKFFFPFFIQHNYQTTPYSTINTLTQSCINRFSVP